MSINAERKNAAVLVSSLAMMLGVCADAGYCDLAVPSFFGKPKSAVVVAKRDIKEGQLLTADDVAVRPMDISFNSQRFAIFKETEAVGWVVRRNVTAGVWLQTDDVVWPMIVRLGKDVKRRDLIKWTDLKEQTNTRLKTYPGRVVDSRNFAGDGMCAAQDMKAGHLLIASDVYAPVVCTVITPAEVASDACKLAGRLEYKKDWAGAIKAYSQAIDLTHGREPSALYSRNKCYQQIGQLDKALADLSRSISMEPSYWGTYDTRAALLLKMKRYAEAHKDATMSINLAKKNSVPAGNLGDPLVHRAQCAFNGARYDEALTDLNEAVTVNPNACGEALYVRSLVNAKLGKSAEAAADLAKAKQLGYTAQK